LGEGGNVFTEKIGWIVEGGWEMLENWVAVWDMIGINGEGRQ